ncbi:hypothetical protein [Symbiopectobacterium sp.]|uniref:hypothetical protein n=1 Tax=Symbiopectobacterium sp. TaxID=2952789 RepID=UPI003F68803C
MRTIVIADTLYYRYIGLSDLFYKKFDGNPDVDVFDHYNKKKLTRRGEYRNALVIGNQTFHEMERTNRLLLANNSDIIVYRIFFRYDQTTTLEATFGAESLLYRGVFRYRQS